MNSGQDARVTRGRDARDTIAYLRKSFDVAKAITRP